jgi:hypothetical protein
MRRFRFQSRADSRDVTAFNASDVVEAKTHFLQNMNMQALEAPTSDPDENSFAIESVAIDGDGFPLQGAIVSYEGRLFIKKRRHRGPGY